ncbi:hypothetical protein [Noviherbaspirillum massiliense]|uniref:hypothetical protein n=1 Tax=Noviherbaspirillum massiliense TaxID=1465823 RepID=UPI0011DDFD6D|nr:hypothetical protein [Noviherbaspirillum massiliense]
MSGKRKAQAQADSMQHPGMQAAPDSRETWEGGGREPVHPDDIGDDGEYLGQHKAHQRLRSDDN